MAVVRMLELEVDIFFDCAAVRDRGALAQQPAVRD